MVINSKDEIPTFTFDKQIKIRQKIFFVLLTLALVLTIYLSVVSLSSLSLSKTKLALADISSFSESIFAIKSS